MKGTCSRYAEYIRFYADLIDTNLERRERKCKDCPHIEKKNNVIIVGGDCRFHVLKELSGIVSYSSLLVVPDLNLIKYSMMEVIEQGLDLVDRYVPSMANGDMRSIHVFKRSRERKWTMSLPLLIVCLTSIACVKHYDKMVSVTYDGKKAS